MTDNQCPECKAGPGKLHKRGCDVERCTMCGCQRIGCDCKSGGFPRLPWTGEWPGVAECREFGWYTTIARVVGPTEDLSRLHVDAVWSVKKKRWEKR